MVAKGIESTRQTVNQAFITWLHIEQLRVKEHNAYAPSMKHMLPLPLDDDNTRSTFMAEQGNKLQEQLNQIWKNDITRVHDAASDLSRSLQAKTRWMILTIRPKDTMPLRDLIQIAMSFIKSKNCLRYAMSFEQKGVCMEDLGKGLHFHMAFECPKAVAKSTIIKAFADKSGFASKWIPLHLETNCIDVDTNTDAGRAEAFVENYLVHYRSKDDHKEPMRQWDDKWRQREGLKPLYDSVDNPLTWPCTPLIEFP